MTQPHINESATRSQPRQAAVGQLDDHASVEDVTNALIGIGIDPDRIYFLIGQDGATVLDRSQGLFSVFDDVIEKPLAALRAGHTIVGVFGTDKDNAATVREALIGAGVINNHYFGKWTYV